MADRDGINVAVTGSSGELGSNKATPRGCPRNGEGVTSISNCSGPKENTVCLEFCPLGKAKSARVEGL
jgi:hypothetical protein